MKKTLTIIFIYIFSVGIIGCKNGKSDNSKPLAKSDEVEKKANESMSYFNCDSAWSKLIFTSNYSPLGSEFDNDSLDYKINGEDVSDSSIYMQIVAVNKGYTLPMGWLKLDKNRGVLQDITQEDSVVNLEINKEMLKAVLSNCSTSN
jgi:hypothetical protein